MSVELCLDHPWDNFVPLWVRTRFFSTAKDLRLKQIISYHNLLCWKSRPNITQITFALGITNYLSPGGGRILEGFHGLHEERRDQVSPTVGTIENWLPMRAVHKNGILFSLARQGVLWISFFPSVCFTEKKTLSISSSCCCWISACFTVLTIARCSSSLVEKCLVQHPAAKTYTQSCQSRVHGGAEIGTCRLKECYRFFL